MIVIHGKREKKVFLLLKVGKKEKMEDMLFDLEIGFLHRMLWIILFVHMYSKVSSFININSITTVTISIMNIIIVMACQHRPKQSITIKMLINRRQSRMNDL